MTHILVLQWPGSTAADFVTLLETECALESGIGDTGIVDGHDFGSGQMNIFIGSEQPEDAFVAARRTLGDRLMWHQVRAAFRETRGETYTVLWPLGLTDFHVT